MSEARQGYLRGKMVDMTAADESAWWVAFGASVRDARKSRGFRQEDLAERTGLTRSSVANIESGRQHTSAYFAARLIAELGMSVPGWTVDPTTALLAQQLIQAREALFEIAGHSHAASLAAQKGLD